MSSPDSRSPSGFLVAFLLGALAWAVWLGWDRTASYDVITKTVQAPYVTLQVLGCAVTVLVVTAVLGARRSPLVVAAGVALGFWLGWTVSAATQDDSGLFIVGSVLLAFGLAGGTTVAALIGAHVSAVVNRRRGRRDGLG